MVSSLDALPAQFARYRLLDTTEAAAFCRLSVAHWRRLYRTGTAPAPVRLSARKYGWRVGDLIDWIDTRRTSAAYVPGGSRDAV
jgi:predicted DNA-binding transcriptional regulator AlpA